MVDDTRDRIGDEFDETAGGAGEGAERIADAAGRGADIEPPGAGGAADAGTDDTLLAGDRADRTAGGDDRGLMDKIKDAITGDDREGDDTVR